MMSEQRRKEGREEGREGREGIGVSKGKPCSWQGGGGLMRSRAWGEPCQLPCVILLPHPHPIHRVPIHREDKRSLTKCCGGLFSASFPLLPPTNLL